MPGPYLGDVNYLPPSNLGTPSQEKVLMGRVDIKKTNLEGRGLLEIG